LVPTAGAVRVAAGNSAAHAAAKSDRDPNGGTGVDPNRPNSSHGHTGAGFAYVEP